MSIVHKSNGDLDIHLRSEKHRKAVRGDVASTKLTNYFVTAGNKFVDEITAAEDTFAFHAVKHHHSFLSMDCTSVFMGRQVKNDLKKACENSSTLVTNLSL